MCSQKKRCIFKVIVLLCKFSEKVLCPTFWVVCCEKTILDLEYSHENVRPGHIRLDRENVKRGSQYGGGVFL